MSSTPPHLGPQSTSRKLSSKQLISSTLPSIPHEQDKLLHILQAEIGRQTWQFPPGLIAKMLSPKRHKRNREIQPYPSLDDFDFLVDQPVVQESISKLTPPKAPKLSTDERSCYGPLADFLNECIHNGNTAYRDIVDRLPEDCNFAVKPIGKRYWSRLTVASFDKPTKDGIRGEAAIKPSLVFVDGYVDSRPLPPGTQNDLGKKCIREVLLAGGVKGEWRRMVRQAATYARAMFSAMPLRAFALVIAVNHRYSELRFLIFHRGGLSASTGLKLDQEFDRLEVQKILLSVLLWQTPSDAGLPSFTDTHDFLLPLPRSLLPVEGKIEAVYHVTCAVRSRATWVGRVKVLAGSRAPSSSESAQPEMDAPRPAEELTEPLLALQYLKCLQQKAAGSPSPSAPSPQVPQPLSIARITRVLPRSEPAVSLRSDYDPEFAIQAKHYGITESLLLKDPMIIGEGALPDQETAVIVKCSWPTPEKRTVEADLYTTCRGVSGVAQQLVSFHPTYPDGSPMSNSIFVPADRENWQERNWDIFLRSPELPDRRSLCTTVLAKHSDGTLLTECTDPWDLINSMLGWLGMYQRGWMHRDVSIGNVLKLKEPVKGQFTATEVVWLIKDALPRPATADVQMNKRKYGDSFDPDPTASKRRTVSPSISNIRKSRSAINLPYLSSSSSRPVPAPISNTWELVDEMVKADMHCEHLANAAKDLESALKDYGLPDECTAIICDGDMAAYMPDYLDKESCGSPILSLTDPRD